MQRRIMKQFTLRGLILGIVGLLVITTSSMYVALRMGALPWPTVFVTVLSMAVLGRFKNSTLQEINVTHTLMSAGAMVAGGLAFTLPGIWMLDPTAQVPLLPVFVVTVLGAVLGTVCSALYRKTLIEEQKLPYPIGRAAYETLRAGVERGKQAMKLFISMALSVVFTIFRDLFGWIPAVFTVYGGGSAFRGEIPPVSFWVSPMALAIGAVIDKAAALCWLLGGVLSYFVLSPLGCSEAFRQNLGIGLMIGTGVGILIRFVFGALKGGSGFTGIKRGKVLSLFFVVLLFAGILSVFVGVNALEALVAVLLAAVACLLCGMLTGQSGINPMEIFGILVMLGAGLFSRGAAVGAASGGAAGGSLVPLFCIAALAAVSCGLSGDVTNDLKSGHLLGTDPREQIKAEAIGGVVGAVLSVLVLFLMHRVFGAFGTEALPAPQARAVSVMAGSFRGTTEFYAGILIGAVLFLLGLPTATLGLGVYLSMMITLPVGLGALLGGFAKKIGHTTETDVNLYSSGALGGEGIAGVIIAFISMLR